jgi:hypothetical protein
MLQEKSLDMIQQETFFELREIGALAKDRRVCLL